MGSGAEIERVSDPVGARNDAQLLVDMTIGAVAAAVTVGGGAGRRMGAAVSPVVGLVLRPPAIPASYQPITWLTRMARHGDRRRAVLVRELSGVLDVMVPAMVGALAGRLDVTDVVRRYVDLDELVATVDLDAVAARLDVAAVINRVDLVHLAEAVIAEIDLPQIIRESTASVASETVRGVRMQGISGDEAIGRTMDRLHLRRPRRGLGAQDADPTALETDAPQP